MLHQGVLFCHQVFCHKQTVKVKFKSQQFFLNEPKYLAHMNIELRHFIVFQVLQENYAVDIL